MQIIALTTEYQNGVRFYVTVVSLEGLIPESTLNPTNKFSPEFLSLKIVPLGAVLRVQSTCLKMGKLPTVSEVLDYLREKGIKQGIDNEAIKAALEAKTVDADILVAKTLLPIPGKDTHCKLLSSRHGASGPKIKDGDKVDFRELDAITQVKVGETLATIEPAGDGKPGLDVYGKEIPAKKGMLLPIIPGPGTNLSPDGKSIIATSSGCLVVVSGVPGVGSTLELDKDIDFHTGNIRFEGAVHIKGGVHEGFLVEATGDIEVEGEVDAATLISKGGSITIRGGVFGRGKGRLEAKAELHVGFAQQCQIECHSLIAAKYIKDCTVKADTINASSTGCLVSGCTINAFGSVLLADAGGEGSRTEIVILDAEEEALRVERVRLEAENAKDTPEMEALDRKLRTQKAIIAKAGAGMRIPPKVAEEMKQTVAAFQILRSRLTNIQAELAMVQQELCRPRNREFILRIGGRLEGNLILNMFYIRRILDINDSKKEYRVLPNEGLVGRVIS